MAFHLDILSFCTTVFTRFRDLESTRLLALLQGFDENSITIDKHLMCRRLPSFAYSIYTVKDFQAVRIFWSICLCSNRTM